MGLLERRGQLQRGLEPRSETGRKGVVKNQMRDLGLLAVLGATVCLLGACAAPTAQARKVDTK